MVRITGVRVTPDGRTVVLTHRRMSGVLPLLEWIEKPTSGDGKALSLAANPLAAATDPGLSAQLACEFGERLLDGARDGHLQGLGGEVPGDEPEELAQPAIAGQELHRPAPTGFQRFHFDCGLHVPAS
ncbi:MAG TPA: hypothetical protein VGG91_21025 [Myxococcaceae bacterium]